MSILYLDLETYSATPIKHGAYRYGEDAEVLLVALAWDDEPVEVWDLTDSGGKNLQTLQLSIDTADQIVIHNSMFDRTVLAAQGIHVPVEKIFDTMVLALQHGLPGSLGMLCDILGVPVDKAKDKAGKKLIHLFTKPCPKNWKLRRATSATHPEEWTAFIEYARLDVDAMRDIYGRLVRWNNTRDERQLWLLDQRINDRGIGVDVGLARSATRAFGRASRSLATRATELTGGRLTSATQRDALLRYLREECGVELPDLTKKTVETVLAGDLDPHVRELLEIRQQASATSPAKFTALEEAANTDGRLRGIIQFCGAARTGRDAGRIFQPQNLPRPTLSEAQIDLGIKAMKLDCEDVLFDNVSELCASAVRGALVAQEGRKLVIADLSNIEGRVLAWLANEEWKLQAFRDFDKGEGHDLYVMAYAKAFNVKPEDVIENKKSGNGSMRQIGKILELSMGYQGSVGAFAKMGGEAMGLSENEVRQLVRAWRKSNKRIQSFWYDIENAAKSAVDEQGTTAKAGLVQFDARKDNRGVLWLRMRLPSGRYVCYYRPRIADDGRLLYEGVDQFTRQWKQLETYGGKLVENLVQATARDVFMYGMRLAEENGYPVCIRVHDELVCETPDTDEWTAEGLSALMATNPNWSAGLPLAAAGFESDRYRKD
jgi:DNA polymerase